MKRFDNRTVIVTGAAPVRGAEPVTAFDPIADIRVTADGWP
jgi:hypothetical protein